MIMNACKIFDMEHTKDDIPQILQKGLFFTENMIKYIRNIFFDEEIV